MLDRGMTGRTPGRNGYRGGGVIALLAQSDSPH
jgi:hypothetical protein